MDIFIPGRLLIVGDHSDWVGQFKKNNKSITPTHAIISGINQGIYATVEKSSKFTFKMNDKEFQSNLDEVELKNVAEKGEFFSYVAGTVYQFRNLGGLSVNITKMDLPIGKGLASSAAICVLITRAYNLIYDLKLSTEDEMLIAYLGESMTPSTGGRGDQACAFGCKPVHIIFDGENVKTIPINVKGEFYFIIADLNASKDTIKICGDLQQAFLKNSEEKYIKAQDFLLNDNTKICEKSIEALETGNVKLLGDMMNKSYKLFDEKMSPLSPEQLKAPILHSVINDEKIQNLIYGAKGIGAQGDGSIQLLCKDENSQKELQRYLFNKYKMKGVCFLLKQ